MKVHIIFLMYGYISMAFSLPTNEVLKSDVADSTQAKRDLSLSYAATDIGSKEGTHVKTITVIKNVAGKKDKPLKIDPKLHSSEDWGSHFRDNFNTYGVIPDVPDIDDLFEFVNKKEDKKPKEKDNPKPKEPEEQDKDSGDSDGNSNDEDEATTTTSPAPVEEVPNEAKDEKVQKIAGDAELIQPGGKQGKVKSQSLDLGKYSVQESMLDENYSTPDHSIRQFYSNSGKKHDKYIQSPSTSYYYPQPGRSSLSGSNEFPHGNNNYSPRPQFNRGSVSVTTPSGKKFDVPLGNVTDIPYIAPNFRRIQNSPPGQPIVSSSQRPYIAPNVRKSYDIQLNNTSTGGNNNRQQPAVNVYRNIPTNIRTNSFGGYKPNNPRSRGLRY